MVEWSEDHMVDIGSLKLEPWKLCIWLNWRPGRTLRWKVETVSWEGQGVVCGKLAPRRLKPPPLSVKDRWVDPREQVLNVLIACWYMDLVSLVAWHQQRVALPPLLQWPAQERNWIRTRGLVSHRAVDYVKSPFSREQWLCPSLLMTSWKVVIRGPCEIRIVDGHTRTKHEKHMACWSGFPLQGVHRFESPWLSDMSTACLCQSSRR
jgi:hypothetical protein